MFQGNSRLAYFLAGVAWLTIASCVNDIEKVKLLSSRAIEPVESAEDIRIVYSDSGRVQAEITAPEMDHYAGVNPYIEMPEGFLAVFFDDNRQEKNRLSAGYGIRHEQDEKMEARKNVVVVNQKGETLNTEHLIWDERREKLMSNEFVKITTKSQVIYGEGFEANQDFTRYRIFNIKGTFSTNSNEPHKDS